MGVRKPPKGDSQLDMFAGAFSDVAIRDSQDTMEVPFLALSTNRFKPLHYKKGNVEMTVSAGEPYGIATVWDWDIILWLLSQIREGLDSGSDVSRKLRFNRHPFLKAARRKTDGEEYRRLKESLERLKATSVETTIRAPKGSKTAMFSWIEYLQHEEDEDGNICDIVAVLPEWLYEAVTNHKLILTLHRDYFLLRGGYERWLYRLIRKQAGKKSRRWSFKQLHERSGTTQLYKEFSRELKALIERINDGDDDEVHKGTLLGYRLRIETKGRDRWLFAEWCPVKQESLFPEIPGQSSVQFLHLRTATYETAKELLAGLNRKYDVYVLEQQWQAACQKKGEKIRRPDDAFLSYVREVKRRSQVVNDNFSLTSL